MSSPIRIAVCALTVTMPSCWAAFGPSTTTRSALSAWPRSNTRPLRTTARTAANSSGDAAATPRLRAALDSGSLTGEVLTSRPPTLTWLTVPAATTPFNRCSRCGASHGIMVAPGVAAEGRTVTMISVAASSSKRPAMRLLAVLDSPTVATRAASPTTVPRIVSVIRPGLANSPETASSSRSDVAIRGGAASWSWPDRRRRRSFTARSTCRR